MIPDILGEDETAALLRCAVSTIRERARLGDLPGLQYGDGGWVFPKAALLEHLNSKALAAVRARGGLGSAPKLEVPLNGPYTPHAEWVCRTNAAGGFDHLTPQVMKSMLDKLDQATGQVFATKGGVPQNH